MSGILKPIPKFGVIKYQIIKSFAAASELFSRFAPFGDKESFGSGK